MKKVYITPSAEALNFVAETMLAGSIKIEVGDDTVDAGTSFSEGKGGWSSENWSGEEE